MVGHLRSRTEGYLRHPGRDRKGRGRSAPGETAGGGGASCIATEQRKSSPPTISFSKPRLNSRRQTPRRHTRAISLLDQAIALDPNYAEAYALKARALYFHRDPGGRGRPRNISKKARAAARAALALKPDLASAHASIAYIYIFADWNFSAAEAEFCDPARKTQRSSTIWRTFAAIQSRLAKPSHCGRRSFDWSRSHAVSYESRSEPLVQADGWDEAEAALRQGARTATCRSGNAHWYPRYRRYPARGPGSQPYARPNFEPLTHPARRHRDDSICTRRTRASRPCVSDS